MEEMNNPSQPTDVEQPHHPANHNRPFFYVQPPTQPYFMYQWPMDPFGQYGFPGPGLPFGRPYLPPYPFMQYPSYVVPHAPMQPTDYRRVTPLFPSVSSYDLRFRQHFQQMSVHRDTTSSEAQTEPGDPVSKFIDCFDGHQACEKSGAVRESKVMLSSTPGIISYTHEVEKVNCGHANPASELAKSEQGEKGKPATFGDSAVYDTEGSHGQLEECALSGVLPLDTSSVHEEIQSRGRDKLQDKDVPHFQCEKLDSSGSANVLANKSSVGVADGQDSGACISDISGKSDPCETQFSDQGEHVDFSPKPVEVADPLMQTAIDQDLAYQILRLPCNKTTTGLALQKEVNPLMYMDAAASLLPGTRYSFGNSYSYSYYPQVTQERQSVLSPSLDELSSRDEVFSTDVEDELMPGQVYISGGKLAETSAPTSSNNEHRDNDSSCSICAKTCACCGASLPDEDETVLTKRYGFSEKNETRDMSDQDCECELVGDSVPSPCESEKAALRKHASRHVLPSCAAKRSGKKMQKEGVELSEKDQSHGRGECGEQLHVALKADRIREKGPKGGQSRSYMELQWREGRQGEMLSQESWTSCSAKQKPKLCRSTNGSQEKGRSGRRRPSCKMFAPQKPRRNAYDDNDEAEFSNCQRGRGSVKRRGTRY
ncbi:bucky ball-like [Hoplias malabaricus]|uniref:bucky ball-like n=1 Tax=Hoplias malabaricus TaxID=27720 RepID=UPI003462E36A